MRVAKTVDINLLSSSVPESTLPEYSSGITYSADQLVKVSLAANGTAITPVIEYKSLADNNQGNYPPENPSKWSSLGATNRWAMFDKYLNTKTESSDQIQVQVGASQTDLVGLFRLSASAVTLELMQGDIVKKEETISLRTLPAPGWYSWLYDEYDYKTKLLWNYAKYADARLKVTITPISGKAACGSMVIGKNSYLGQTLYGARVGINDYSILEEDSRGGIYLNPGLYSDRAEIEMWLSNFQIDAVKRILTDVRGRLSLWDLNNGPTVFESLMILGYYRSFDIIIPGALRSKCTIEIGGIT